MKPASGGALRRWASCWLACAAGLPVSGLSADAVQSQVLKEDDHWRVVRSAYPPGAAGSVHTHHWPRVIYVLQGGSVRLTDANGASVEVELETGQLLARGPETHAVANTGDSIVEVLETEARPPAESSSRPD
ncbi:MAG: cupin domain-containing protein [Xanthomonadales bacterium]|nr:cupin domain-containing protein [Xanthomonadales bacterium]